MLLNYPQFLIHQAVKSPMHLVNPKVISSDEIALPRNSVIHYLDYANEVLFPSRSLPYLANVRPTKRIPVWHITHLVQNNDTTVPGNRTLERQLRAWRKSNTQQFKVVELLQIPNSDVQTHALFNYQALKGLYLYKSSATASLNRYRNVYASYWDNVHAAVAVDNFSEHFVHIPVPSMIPSKALLDNILKYPDVTFARVVKDPELNGLIQLYQYLNTATRAQSLMSVLTEQDCTRVTVELTHKGYSCFFKLSYLVALSEDSTLESKRKIGIKQLQRLFLLMMLKVQQKVYDLQNNTLSEEEGEEASLSESVQDMHSEMPQSHDEDTDDPESLPAGLVVRATPAAIFGPTQKKDEDGFSADGTDELEDLLESDFSQLEGGSDDIFAKLMSQANEPVVDETKPSVAVTSVLNQETDPALEVDYSTEHKTALLKTQSLQEGFDQYVDMAKGSGAISTVETRSLKKLFETRQALKSPYGDQGIDVHKQVLPEDVSFTAEDTMIPVQNNLVDDALKSETVFNFDRLYLKKLLHKDVLGCVTQIEAAGIIIKDYQVEKNESALGSYEVHKLTLKPYKGKESTVYFRLPIVDEEGEFSASGIKYRMRKQRQDNPIRKISPSRVALTSNYGKLFVARTERRSYDPYTQIAQWVKKEYLSGSGGITEVTPGNGFNNLVSKPNMYMAMSQDFRQFSTPTHTFVFHPEDTLNMVKKDMLDKLEKDGKYCFVGYCQADKSMLVMDKDNLVYTYQNDTFTPVGDLPTLLGMDVDKLPIQFATVKVLGDTLALGVVMSYYLGFKGLLEVTDTQFSLIGPRQQSPNAADQIVVRLQDCKVLVTADTPLKKLLFGGFAYYKDTLKTIDLTSLEDKGVYLTLFEQRGSTLMHLRELDLLQQLFLDPITTDVLKSMDEPTEYLPVLLRACSLLSDFQHPDVNDPRHSRIRGYDRIPGLMYRVLTQSVRTTKLGMSKGKVELDPYGVWNAVTQDTTVKIIEDSNPITDAKEAEAVTFSGADGLNKSSTPERMRRYHPKDIGLISEATVDSTDVALNIYLTPYAKLENLRGKVSDKKQERQDTVFSTSVLLSPMAENDDPKRIN